MKRIKKKGLKKGVSSQNSPKAYIKSGKARKLPIYKCIRSYDAFEEGMIQVVVAREHKSGNVTVGMYLLDTYCLGLKDSFYMFNIPKYEFDDIFMNTPVQYKDISLNTASNMVYEAIDFAKEAGLQPAKDFALTQYIIEDENDIEYENIPVGRDGTGRHFLLVKLGENRSKELAIIRKALGEGNFDVLDFNNPEEYEVDESPSHISEILDDDEYEIYEAYMEKMEVDFDYLAKLESTDLRQMIITEDPISDGTDSFVHPDYEELHNMAISGNKKTALKRLEAELKKYPDYSPLYNFLTNLHQRMGNWDKALALAEETVRKFPNYIFGYIVLGTILFRKFGDEKFLEVMEPLLEGRMNLVDMNPERKEFHVSEFFGFTSLLAERAICKGEFKNAIMLLNSLYISNMGTENGIMGAQMLLQTLIERMYRALQKEGKLPKGQKDFFLRKVANALWNQVE